MRTKSSIEDPYASSKYCFMKNLAPQLQIEEKCCNSTFDGFVFIARFLYTIKDYKVGSVSPLFGRVVMADKVSALKEDGN